MKYADPTKLYVERERPFVERDTFSNVDQVGYVTFDQQVRGLILAGERVAEWKHRELYEYPDGEVDEAVAKPDPTMDVGFDLADASEILRATASSISRKKAVAVKGSGEDTSAPDSSVEVTESK